MLSDRGHAERAPRALPLSLKLRQTAIALAETVDEPRRGSRFDRRGRLRCV